MAGADNIVFNTREKPISQDWNDVQALDARTLATVLRFWTMSRLSGLGVAADTETIHPIVNGLQVVPNGSNVDVQPGFLLQESASISPAPGSLDSPYRVALNHTNLAVTAPSPAGNTFYLLEAQMQETTTSTESRAILNASTGNFVATSVAKRKERRLLTQWVTGTSSAYPAPTGGNWGVLAGVFRPAGGGAVSFSHIQDMRLQPDLLIGEAHLDRGYRPRVGRVSVDADGDTTVKISADADIRAGATFSERALRLHLRNLLGGSPAGFTPTSALVVDPTTTLSGDSWYYLYLTHWNGLAPRTYTANIVSRGVPVLSHVQPSLHSAVNSASVNLPAPFSGSVGAGTACCVAILRRNASNTGWRAVHGAGDTHRFAGLGPTLLTDTGTFPGIMNVAAAELPRARLLKIAIHMAITLTGTTSAEAYLKFEAHVTGSAGVLSELRIPLPGASTTTRWDFEMDVPYSGTGYDFELALVAVSGTLTAASGTFNAYCAGWTF